MNQKLALVYDRASRDLQKDNWSRKDAQTIGPELAKKAGFNRVEILEEVESGESLLNRPVMKDILERCAAGQVGAIVVQNFSRLTRDTDGLDGLTIKKVCKDNNVLVITPGKTYNFATGEDDKLSDIELMVGRWYKTELMKFTAQGLKARAREGKYMGGVPNFGFKLIYQQANESDKPVADLAIEPGEAETVRVLFDLYVNHHLGAIGTAKELNRLGLRYRGRKGNGHKKFVTDDILRLVKNSIYIGFMRWGHGKNGSKSKYLADFEGTMVHRPDLQIIPIKLWEEAQEIRLKRSQQYNIANPGNRSQYAFTGIVICPKCGGPMAAKRHSGKRHENITYFCCHHYAAHDGCLGYTISQNLVARVLVPFLAETITKQIDIGRALNEAANEYGRTSLDDDIANLVEAEIVSTQEQKKRIIDSIADGLLTKGEAQAKLDELREKLDRLQRKLADITGKDEIRAEYQEAVNALKDVDLLTTLSEMWQANPVIFKRILGMIFKSVTVKSSGASLARRNVEIINYEYSEGFKVFCQQSRGGYYKIPTDLMIDLSGLLTEVIR